MAPASLPESALIRYDAMCFAISECHAVDEVKDIRDKALALEIYAQQAKNTDAEHKAAEIRVRAERRAGELLIDMKESGSRASAQGNLKHGPKSPDTSSGKRLSDLGISADQSSKWQQLAAIPDHQFESAFRDPDVKPTTEGVLRRSNPLMSSESDEWNTPPEILDLVGDVLGKIDLDPCCNDGDQNVPAKHVLRRADDGLQHTWRGKVYMNPPYGDAVTAWIDKLIEEHVSGNVPEAIALVAARVDTKWFQKLEPYRICFVRGRLKFGDSENSATFPSAAIYFGKKVSRFVQVFSAVAWFPNLGG